MKRYNPTEIEPKWQQIWRDDNRYEAPDASDKPKYYVTGMFPYPSGAGMHVGHFMEHSIVDAVARFRRANGHNVIYPMGWDAFGLPAENYAIKTGQSPQVTTETNIASFKNQLTRVGASIDWSREVKTSDPEYYKWTQWVFTQLFERGLAYQKEANQWWCPVDMTVLANEQVEAGKCWRCGSVVEKRAMKQWFFKITDYADALLEEIPALDWPEKIKLAQTNWIGRSEGAEIDFAVIDEESRVMSHESRLGQDEVYSYVMGQKNISVADIEGIGGRVEQETDAGHLCVVLPRAATKKFEKLIGEKIEPGFWNEYIAKDEVVFLFKQAEGSIERIAWSSETENQLLKLCNEFAKTDFSSIRQMLLDNTWYSNLGSYLLPRNSSVITVFTTRPDTIFGATFIVIAPEHPLVKSLTTDDTRAAVEQYVTTALKKSDIERMSEGKEKTGVFAGSYAVNPANGEQIPIWIADYVLGGYGTGAVMAVPAHDERDYEFATKFNLPIIEVIEKPADNPNVIFHAEGLLINSEQFDGVSTSEAREQIVAWLEQQGVGRRQVTYKMRDWLVSRQRYWGAPIPIVHCEKDGAVAVPTDQLPVLLPEVEDYTPKGQSVLASQADWVQTTCPTCGGPARRETDTMDGYACSSWYLLRYTDPHNAEQAWAPEKAEYWTPLDMYVGGDHAVAHLLYVRFWNHVFYDMGLVPTKEPVKKLVYHGLIQAEDGRKMSKSLGNVVDPLEVIDQGYGADALRTFELFLGPIDENSNWSSRGIAGVYRFLNRAWTLTQELIDAGELSPGDNAELIALRHRTVKKVTSDIYRLSFNTAIAALMEYVNDLYKLKTAGFNTTWREPIETLVQLIAPFAPHMAAELWQQLGRGDQLDVADWPTWNDDLTIAEAMTVVVQVNGKLRAKLDVPKDASEADITAEALAHENIVKHLDGKQPTKVVYVPGRLVSIVI